MTLGIGTICESGECIVLASDRRITYGATPIGPNDDASKQYRLRPLKCCVLVAGRMSTSHAIFSQFQETVLNLKDKDTPPELLMNLFDDARFRELKRIYDWELKHRCGFTLHEWATGKISGTKMNKLIVEAGLIILENIPLRSEMIVAGFVRDWGVFFKASQKQKIEEETSPGTYVIGSGSILAMEQLNKRGQNVHMTLGRTLLHVYEAMLKAQSKTVGPPPELVTVIRKREAKLLVYPLVQLETWRREYESRTNTASLDDSHLAAREVAHRLRYLKEDDLDKFE